MTLNVRECYYTLDTRKSPTNSLTEYYSAITHSNSGYLTDFYHLRANSEYPMLKITNLSNVATRQIHISA